MTDPIDMQLAQLLAAPERAPDEAFVARTEALVRFDRARAAARKAAFARVGLEAMASGAVVAAFAGASRVGEASEQVALFSPAMAGLITLGLWCALTLRSPRAHAAG
jgi:hypothetical protein